MTWPSIPPVVARAAPPLAPEPGWYTDPFVGDGLRWWDGWRWTAHAAPGPGRPSPPAPTLPVRAAVEMCAVILALTVGLRFGLTAIARPLGPELAVLLSYTVLFGGMFLCAWYASRRYGTGAMRHDLGIELRWIDLALGPAVAVGLYIGQVVLAAVLRAFNVPLGSNGQIVGGTTSRPWLFLVLVVAGVIGAPIFEEIAFRGVIMRSLASRWPGWAAILGSSILFGLYHFTPELGAGNIGLIIILTAIGAGLAATAWLTRRLGAGMIAHALMNGFVFALLWSLGH